MVFCTKTIFGRKVIKSRKAMEIIVYLIVTQESSLFPSANRRLRAPIRSYYMTYNASKHSLTEMLIARYHCHISVQSRSRLIPLLL